MGKYSNYAVCTLTFVAAVMLVISFYRPWWVCKFSETTNICIYGWGLRHNLGRLVSYVINDITPIYQTFLAWIYIGVSAALILTGLFTKRKTIILLQIIVGISYIAYTLMAMYVVIAKRLTAFGIALQGTSIPKGAIVAGIVVQSAIQPGFYLALASGGLIVLLAMLRLTLNRNKLKNSI